MIMVSKRKAWFMAIVGLAMIGSAAKILCTYPDGSGMSALGALLLVAAFFLLLVPFIEFWEWL